MEILIYSLGPFVAVFLILAVSGFFTGRPAPARPRWVVAAVLVAAIGVAAGLLGMLMTRG